MHLHEIENQSWSTLVAQFFVCNECQIVDTESERMRVGYPCPQCQAPSDPAQLYFGSPVHSLIDLMQEAYFSNTIVESYSIVKNADRHNISVVLYYCTLREVVFEQLLIRLCRAQEIPRKVIERLLADNNTHKKRLDNLFPSLTSIKWNKLIQDLNSTNEIDFVALNRFFEKVVKARNEFLHEGNHWCIDQSLKVECIENIFPLMQLIVAAHNAYVHPHYFNASHES
jgi:hypothetical protein